MKPPAARYRTSGRNELALREDTCALPAAPTYRPPPLPTLPALQIRAAVLGWLGPVPPPPRPPLGRILV